MVLRSIGYAPLMGLSLLFALPGVAEDVPAGMPDAVAPSAAASDTSPADEPALNTSPAADDAAPAAMDEPASETAPQADTPEAAPDADMAPADEPEMEAAPDDDAAPMADQDTGIESAPAPDAGAFLDEAYLTCVSALESPDGAYDLFNAADWAPQPDEGSETPYYRQFNGVKSYPGIGEATLFYSIEVFPSMTINYCMISVDNTEVSIPVADLINKEDLTGLVRRTGNRIFSIWENAVGEPDLFVQAEHNTDDGSFVLDATYNAIINAADLPPLMLSGRETSR